MENNENGYIYSDMIFGLTMFLIIIGLVFTIFFVRFSVSEQRISGIVYNTKNNVVLSGNTKFSVRAAENTYVSEENISSYCLPPDSPYIDLVNRAAEDKTIKVIVTTEKYFAVQLPWTCQPVVTVTEVKAKETN